MMLKLKLTELSKRPEIRVAFGYIVLGVLWILFSDYFLKTITTNKEELASLQSYKGIFFIFFSGLFVYLLSKNEIDKREKIEEKMLLKEKELQMRIVQSEERERNRIAKDLHDGLQQKLAGLNLFAESLNPGKNFDKHLKIIKSLIQESMQETRNISFNLNSSLVERKGLKLSLKKIEHNINSLGKLNLYLDCYFEEEIISYILKNNIYRIVQELITNTIKHASAKNIDLHIWHENNKLKISYSDDGVGISNIKDTLNNGQGMSNIKERVEMLSGTINFEEKERGFSVDIDFVLNEYKLKAV
ncbi:MAG: histidine kinase [Chitinophagales bacterium]